MIVVTQIKLFQEKESKFNIIKDYSILDDEDEEEKELGDIFSEEIYNSFQEEDKKLDEKKAEKKAEKKRLEEEVEKKRLEEEAEKKRLEEEAEKKRLAGIIQKKKQELLELENLIN